MSTPRSECPVCHDWINHDGAWEILAKHYWWHKLEQLAETKELSITGQEWLDRTVSEMEKAGVVALLDPAAINILINAAKRAAGLEG